MSCAAGDCLLAASAFELACRITADDVAAAAAPFCSALSLAEAFLASAAAVAASWPVDWAPDPGTADAPAPGAAGVVAPPVVALDVAFPLLALKLTLQIKRLASIYIRALSACYFGF